MGLFIAKTRKQLKDGRQYPFYVLRLNFWDAKAKAVRQKHVAYIGTKPELTLEKAKRIAKEKKIALEALKSVKGLSIIEA